MRIGEVSAVEGTLEPSISITMHMAAGEDLEVYALMDTGFSGEVALPMSVIEYLGLEYARGRIVALADGSFHRVETYLDQFSWWENGTMSLSTAREAALQSDLRLLRGAKVSFEAVPNGRIDWHRIAEPRPHWTRLRR